MKKDVMAEVREIRCTIPVTVEIPKDIDDLVTKICQMDGTSKREFYEEKLLDNIQAYLNTGELFNMAGLAETFHLKKHLKGLDPSMFGEGE